MIRGTFKAFRIGFVGQIPAPQASSCFYDAESDKAEPHGVGGVK